MGITYLPYRPRGQLGIHYNYWQPILTYLTSPVCYIFALYEQVLLSRYTSHLYYYIN
jgi:hypothetical protein